MDERYPLDPLPSKVPAIFYAAYFGVLGIVLPHLGPYLEWRGLGAVGVGLITAAFSLAKLIYAPWVGTAVDRGRWIRGLLTGHIVVAALCAAVVPMVGAGWLVGILLFLVGTGHGTVLPLVEATVLERLPEAGYGRLRLWGSLGFVAVALGGSALLGAVGTGAFPLLLAVVLTLLAVACLPFERVPRPLQRESSGEIPRPVWLLLGVLCLHQVSHGPYYAFFSIHLEAAGYSGLSVGALWSVGVVAELGAFFASRRLESRLGLRCLLTIALALTPVRWLLLAGPPLVSIVLVAQLGHAVTFALAHVAGIQIVQLLSPPRVVRRAQALYSGLTFGLGIVVGSALAGPVYGTFGGRGAFAAAAALAVVVVLLWLPLARKLGDRGGAAVAELPISDEL